jgi:hypothetical protein
MPRNKGGRCLFFFELWFTKKQTKQNNVFVYFYLIQVKQILRVMVAFLGHFFSKRGSCAEQIEFIWYRFNRKCQIRESATLSWWY